jgi:hypothetical protein
VGDRLLAGRVTTLVGYSSRTLVPGGAEDGTAAIPVSRSIAFLAVMRSAGFLRSSPSITGANRPTFGSGAGSQDSTAPSVAWTSPQANGVRPTTMP